MTVQLSVAPCHKCGWHDVLLRYVGANRRWTELHYSGDSEEGEHFRLTCKRCGYAWNAAIPDANREPTPPTEEQNNG